MTTSRLREKLRERAGERIERCSKIAREGVSNVVGGTWKIVETGDVSMKTLMDTKEAEEVSGRGVGSGATFAFPEGSV